MGTPFAAWVKGRRLAKGWSQTRLAEAIGSHGSIVSRMESTRFIVPQKPRLIALERALGLMPAPVKVFVSGRQDALARPMRKRFEYRIKKWSRARLAEEIAKMGENPTDYLSGVPYSGPVAKRGYDAFMRARAGQMRQHYKGPGRGGPRGPQPRIRLRTILLALEGKLGPRFGRPTQPIVVFQCPSCGDVVGRPISVVRKGAICGLCYLDYLRNGYAQWVNGDRSDPPPPLPRRRGALASPESLRSQIVALLRDVLGDNQPDDRKAISRTFKVLANSRGRWASSIAEACQALGRFKTR